MKPNRIEQPPHHGLFMGLAALLVGGLLVGVFFAYESLRGLWLEQSIVTDYARQVRIVSGKMVKPDVIAEIFGVRVGANLELIDFAARREELLAKVPNLRAVTVTRHLPGGVSITAEERVPIARLNLRSARKESGRVVDTEGVVFNCHPGTQMLPVIRESSPPGMQPGDRLDGMARAALRLIETCRDPDFQELRVLEVDVSRPDYLLVTLASYSRAKIAWSGMAEDTPEGRAFLSAQLRHLVEAIRSRISPSTVIWNVTMPGRVFADTQERL